MKTLTEFNPIQIQQGLKKKAEVEAALRAANKSAPKIEVKSATAAETPAPELGADSAPESSLPVETSSVETSVAETSGEPTAEVTAENAEAAPAETAPEAPSLETALTETFKFEGDKLKFFVNALEVAKRKPHGIKRVVVLTLAETDKPPVGAEKRDEHHYLIEYFPQSARDAARSAQGRGDRDDRGGKRGGRDGKKGGRDGKGRGDRDGKGRGNGAHAPRAPRESVAGVIVVKSPAALSVDGTTAPALGGEKPARGPRKPRPPRAPRPPREPRPAGPAPTSNLMIRISPEGGKVIVQPKENAPAQSAPESAPT